MKNNLKNLRKSLVGYSPSLESFKKYKIAKDKNNIGYIYNNIEYENGIPDILWEQIIFINEEGYIWTHGKFYGQTASVPDSLETTLQNLQNSIDELSNELFKYSWEYTNTSLSNETGKTITPTVTFTVKRKGENVSDKTISVSPNEGTFDGYTWTAPSSISEDKSYTFTLDGTDLQATFNWKFMFYRYKMSTAATLSDTTTVENYIKTTVIKNSSYRELSTSTKIDKVSLKANENYIFIIPNDRNKTVTWTVKNLTGGDLDGYISGDIELPLINDKYTSINYSYIVVPGAPSSWDAKIEATLS